MNLLDAIPEIGKILDDLISTPEEKREAQLRLREIDVREVEARLGVQKAWLSNQSVFVAGAIPTVLWMVSLVIFFNHILAPLLAHWVQIPTLDLPAWYSQLAGTIVLGLFGKKAWDSSEIHWGGQVVKPAKEKVAAEIEEPKPQGKPSRPKPTPRKAAAKPAESKEEEPSEPKAVSEMSSKEVDDRLRQLCEERGIEW
ncbi:3TM-type holin [uncultured Fretibacterium sp.]|uniref:3TM-type holin n=1 Tax=uncultured Fretibacterium sp. TaxID=1678694 RepID=UPI002609CA06|nr:3TM-type holin [uncultured Fretibacterium sp.]